MSRRIAIATCTELPDGDADDQLLSQALADLGIAAEILAWTEPGRDWAAFDATVIRSTWDYPARRPEFLSWLDSVPRLHNPAPVVHANSDKRYLAELAASGLPTVPTRFFAPGQRIELPAADEFVLKPSVGAGSRGAARFDAAGPASAEQATAHARTLHEAGRTVMLQPYLSAVDTAGETALIFFDGRFSHAIAKSAMLTPESRYPVDEDALYVPEQITARLPSADELELAGRVVERLSRGLAEPLLYARIDLIPTDSGPVVLEAELIEPSLFLGYAEHAAGRLASAISDRTG